MKTVITLDDEKFGGNYYHAAHVEVIRGDKTRSAKYVDVDRLLEAMKMPGIWMCSTELAGYLRIIMMGRSGGNPI